MAAYTTIDDPSVYFQLVSWTGNGTDGRTITLPGSTDMRPDFIWVKNRTDAEDHCLMDVVRTFASGKAMRSNGGDEEGGVGTAARGWVEAASDGFTCEDGSSNANLVNASSDTYLAWCWKTQGGTGSSNEAGSINTTTTSVNTTSKFSISTYTGTGSAATIGHGLGAVPHWIICKERGGVGDWVCYHHRNTSAPETDVLELNNSTATADNNGMWNDTAPTSTLITLGGSAVLNNSSDTYVCYAWSEVQGFSKFGTYQGNNSSDGTFVYTGFAPKIVIYKMTSGLANWCIKSKGVGTGYNTEAKYQYLSANSAEVSGCDMDFLSNGFKWRDNAANCNNSNTFVYMAFAESPLVNSNGVPCNAT